MVSSKRPGTKTRECRRSSPSCLAFGLRATCSSPPVRTSASTISPRHAISKLVSFDAALRSAARPHHTAQLKSPPQKATSRHSPRPGPWLCAVSGRSQRTETHLPPPPGLRPRQSHGRPHDTRGSQRLGCCWKTCYTLVTEAVNDLVVAGKTCYTLVTDFLPTGFLLQYNYLDSDVGMPRLHHDSCDSDDEQLKAHGPTRVFRHEHRVSKHEGRSHRRRATNARPQLLVTAVRSETASNRDSNR